MDDNRMMNGKSLWVTEWDAAWCIASRCEAHELLGYHTLVERPGTQECQGVVP
ncbi:hypothetical protein J1N35_033916 [Gossypium stocksii]|uniref:Uncharacterized protein n=1 Tax=Gossypium stocksii TaxID=47602 RepID=A0A9D3ZNT6_9ROSI|nr:hypothetical protein J1N35_033916 [Gossypium stocksii]